MTESYWAADGRIGTGAVPPGGAEISRAEYKAALTVKADPADPRDVKVEDGAMVFAEPPRPEPEPEPEVDRETQRAIDVQGLKNEAGRRILERYPDFKQRNMLARAIELDNALRDRDLTAEEESEITAYRAAWAWIGAVREVSNTIEALDPIPADYADDKRWPPAPA